MKTVLRIVLAGALTVSAGAKEIKLLNVSYDPTRELYSEYNAAFAQYWKARTGDTVNINQSHGGSGKQAQAVINQSRAQEIDVEEVYCFGNCALGPTVELAGKLHGRVTPQRFSALVRAKR